MPEISHTATFSPSDALPLILADLACPACGHQDSERPYKRVTDNKIRSFCDCCGTFVTIALSDQQVRVLEAAVNQPVSAQARR